MSEQSRAHARGCHLGTGDSRHTDKTLDRCLESGHSLVTPAKVTGPDNRGQGQHADIYLSNNSLFSLSLKYGDMSHEVDTRVTAATSLCAGGEPRGRWWCRCRP